MRIRLFAAFLTLTALLLCGTAVATAAPEDPAAAAAAQDAGGRALVPRVQSVVPTVGDYSQTGNVTLYEPSYLNRNETYRLNGYRLTVNGDLTVYGRLVVGHGTLIVNGNLLVDGGALVMTEAGGSVTVSKSVVYRGANSAGSLTAGSVRVKGDFAVQSTYSSAGYAESGTHRTTLEGANKLVQFQSPNSYLKNPVFPTGTTFTAGSRTITLTRTYEAADGGSRRQTVSYAVTGGTQLSLRNTLTANMTVIAPRVWFGGSTGAYTLTVKGALTIPAGAAATCTGSIVANGPLAVDGTLNVSGAAKLVRASGIAVRGKFNMTAPARLECFGTFTAESTARCAFSAGTAVFYGSFYQRGNAPSFLGSGTNQLLFYGRGLTVLFEAPDKSWGSCVAMVAGSTFTSSSVLSINGSLGSEFAFTGKKLVIAGTLAGRGLYAPSAEVAVPAGRTLTIGTLNAGTLTAAKIISNGGGFKVGKLGADLTVDGTLGFDGSLDGHKLTVNGDLDVRSGQTLTLGSGLLKVSGDMRVSGALAMTNPAGVISVGGDYTAAGSISAGKLTAGTLVLHGGFRQISTISGLSFAADAGHVTMLCTAGKPIAFSNPGSHFGTLSLAYAGAAVPSGIPCASEQVTGMGLTGFTMDGTPALCAPAFSENTLSYEALVPRTSASVLLQAQPAVGNEALTYRVNGAVVTAGPGGVSVPVNPNGTAVVAVTATAFGSPAALPLSRTYTIRLEPVNPLLAGVKLNGTAVSGFLPDTLSYNPPIPARQSGFTLAPALANPNASYRFLYNGVPANTATYTRTLAEGETAAVTVEVLSHRNATEPDPVDGTRSYTFNVRRMTIVEDINLSAATLDEAAMGFTFNRAQGSYTVTIPATEDAVTVKAVPGDDCRSMRINGAATTSTVLRPGFGAAATATIVAGDGVTGGLTRVYTVTVRRASLVTGVQINGGAVPLIKPFREADGTLAARLPLANDGATVRVQCGPDADSATLNGTAMTAVSGGFEGTIGVPEGVPATVPLRVQTANGKAATYQLTLSRPFVKGLTLSAGALAQPFAPEQTDITVNIPYTVSSVLVTPVSNGTGVIYTADGSSIPIRFSPATGASQTIVLHATTATAGISKDYRITVRRAKSANANLSRLSASCGTLSPAFKPATAGYTLTLPETAASVKLTPAVEAATSSYKISAASAANTPCTVSAPAVGGSKAVTVVVTAQAGNRRTYTVTIRRPRLLTGLTANPKVNGTPSFSPGGTDRLTVSYSLPVAATVKLELRRSGSSTWRTILSRAEPAGSRSYAWDGRVSGALQAAGTYYLRATPLWGGKAGQSSTLTVKLLSKPTAALPTVTTAFRADGAARAAITCRWTVLCDVRVDVLDAAGKTVRPVFAGANIPASTHTWYWDGRNASGALVAAGNYRARLACGGAAAVYAPIKVTR